MKRIIWFFLIISSLLLLISCELLVKAPVKPTVHVLVVALDYQNSSIKNLYGTITDAVEMAAALNQRASIMQVPMETTMMLQEGSSTTRTDSHYPSRANILAKISQIGSEMAAEDLFVVYYSGHGVGSEYDYDNPNRGDIVTAYTGSESYKTITTAEMNQALSQSNGRVLLLMDSCYSGHHIQAYPDGYSSWITLVDGYDGNIFYLTAASDTQLSWEDDVDGSSSIHKHGLFTYHFLQALGWSHFKVDEGSPDDYVQGTFFYSVDGIENSHPYQGGMNSDGTVPAQRGSFISMYDVQRYISRALLGEAALFAIQTTTGTPGPRDVVLFDAAW